MAKRAKTIRADLHRVARLIPGYDPFATCGDAWFDADAAERAIGFFPAALRHVEGSISGQPFVLEPWQAAIVGNIFGWKRKDKLGREVRRYRQVLVYVGRKNGKTPLASGIGLRVLFCDDEPGQQNYIAATTREQAGLLFRHAKGMVERQPRFAGSCQIYGGTAQGGQARSIVLNRDQSFLRVISSDAGGQHGQNPHCIIVDELHAQENRELIETLRTGTSSLNRKQPLMVYITTADWDRESICNEIYDYAKQVQSGTIDDPTFLPVIYEATTEDDPHDPKTWAKANPNLGVSVSEEYLKTEFEKAKHQPAMLSELLRLHLNVRTKRQTRWLDGDTWRDSAGVVDHEALMGRECCGGLDLSTKTDLTAFVLCFPWEDGSFKLLCRFWITEAKAKKHELARGIPFSAWSRGGHLTIVPGASIRYDMVEEQVKQDYERYQIRQLRYDPWNATATKDRLQAFGVPMVEMPQTLRHMNEPTKEFGRLVSEGLLHHGDQPVLSWCAENCEVYTDNNGNIRPVKPEEGSANRIDGIVAAIMALSGVMGEHNSVYAERGVLIL